MPRRRGTRGSDPLDRDPAAQKGSGLDLIWRVEPRSGGSGRKGARAAALAAPAASLAAAACRSSLKSTLRGSIRPGFGSGVFYAICVIHPRQRNGGLGPGRTLARRGAALGLGVRRRAGVQGARGLGRVCNSAEEHAQDMCKLGWRSCGAVRGGRAFASAELRQESPASGVQVPRVRPGPN